MECGTLVLIPEFAVGVQVLGVDFHIIHDLIFVIFFRYWGLGFGVGGVVWVLKP